MDRKNFQLIHCAAWLLLASTVFGCTGSRNAAETETFFPTPGRYATHATNATRPRAGIPTPAIEPVAGIVPSEHLADEAADQLFWAVDQSNRFNLIEHRRVAELISQRAGAETLKGGELLHPVSLQGIDYLLLCRIAGLSVRGDEKPEKVSVQNVERLLRITTPKPRITTTAIVELKLVNPSTGLIAASLEDHFRRTSSPESMNLSFADPEAAWGSLQLTEEQSRQVLRVVLDDAVRKFLPKVDAVLDHPTATTRPAKLASPRNGLTAMKILCKECGFEATTDDQFCPNCGARLIAKTSPGPVTLPAK
jgi:hypothetical protein